MTIWSGIDQKAPDIISEVILSLSERCQNTQDKPEYNSMLSFTIIIKIFAVSML